MAPVVLADWSRPQLCPTYLRSVAALLLGADSLLSVVPAARGGRERASASRGRRVTRRRHLSERT